MIQPILHYSLHFGIPFFLAYIFYKNSWQKVFLILISTMLVDLDHLFADPIFQADRCSINFHPLHTYYAIFFYAVLLFFKKPYNIIGMGLLIHMIVDFIDCQLM